MSQLYAATAVLDWLSGFPSPRKQLGDFAGGIKLPAAGAMATTPALSPIT
jgi:hypothetical protein